MSKYKQTIHDRDTDVLVIFDNDRDVYRLHLSYTFHVIEV